MTHFPRRYIDMSQLVSIECAHIGENVTVLGQVYETVVKQPKPHLSLVEVTIVDESGIMIATFFRQPWLAKTLKPGTRVSVAGTMEFNFGFKRMTSPFLEILDAQTTVLQGRIIPVHAATEKVPTGQMRRLIENALEMVVPSYDPIPLALRKKYHLMSRNQAFCCIHFPKSMQEVHEARRRLVYEELLCLELYLKKKQKENCNGRYVRHSVWGKHSVALKEVLPFTLTADQDAAILDIASCMQMPAVMNHMLLGDVGTGKTMVAAFACAFAADNATQTLMMAPTEVLAWQYGDKLGPLFDEIGMSWAVLTGSTSVAERESILERLATGKLDVLFGTVALLEPDVVCLDCSLVIIDEQQRFGVEQRQRLREKGTCPDCLSMTATPIPRSLALAVYGSMTLSYIKQVPFKRAHRKTFVHDYRAKGVAYDAARAALARGEQVYIVCPLVGQKREDEKESTHDSAIEQDVSYIENDEDMRRDNTAAAKSEATFLQAKVFNEYKVGLLHGKMTSDAKREVMCQFKDHEIDVLVCTTVIEVGVDVPNATVMIVHDADKFGLSQLHQLRGRVGRGTLPGEIHLIGVTQNPVSKARLDAMAATEDGFKLAEFDLAQRREGDILGNRQSGTSILKLVNIMRDGNVIEVAHADADMILADIDENPDQAWRYDALMQEVEMLCTTLHP